MARQLKILVGRIDKTSSVEYNSIGGAYLFSSENHDVYSDKLKLIGASKAQIYNTGNVSFNLFGIVEVPPNTFYEIPIPEGHVISQDIEIKWADDYNFTNNPLNIQPPTAV